jgi:hypothetical protein
MFRDARTNFSNHFHRILEPPTPQPILLVKPTPQSDRETAVEEMVVNALVQQGAARKNAKNLVRGLRGQGITSFEELFRKAAGESIGRNRNRGGD